MRPALLAIVAALVISGRYAHADSYIPVLYQGTVTEYFDGETASFDPVFYLISTQPRSGFGKYESDYPDLYFPDLGNFPIYNGLLFGGYGYFMNGMGEIRFNYSSEQTTLIDPDGILVSGFYEYEFSASLSTVNTITPEPSSFALLGTGLLGVTGVLRRKYVGQGVSQTAPCLTKQPSRYHGDRWT